MLVTALVDIDELLIRNRQAVRCDQVKDVLEPAIGRLAALRDSMRLIQAEINSAWTEGQESAWKDDN